MNLEKNMKIEVSSVAIKPSIEEQVVVKSDMSREVTGTEPINIEKNLTEESSPKRKTDFIIIGDEKINIVADIAKDKSKRKKRSKKKLKTSSATNQNVELKEKSIISLELEKMQKDG
jgi:spore coat protein CotF